MLRLSLLLTIGISIWLADQTSGQTTTAAMLCSPGQFMGTSGCTTCPAGSFCTGFTRSATPCPIGTSTNNATGASECARCMNGTFTLVTGSRTCTVCPAGSFCPNATRSGTLCPIGTSTNNQTGAAECTRCMNGTYSLTTGSRACTACPAGSFCTNATRVGSLCPIGTSTNNQTGATSCWPCPSGFVATTTGRPACSMCPDGSFCPNATHSIACPRGFASRATFNSTR